MKNEDPERVGWVPGRRRFLFLLGAGATTAIVAPSLDSPLNPFGTQPVNLPRPAPLVALTTVQQQRGQWQFVSSFVNSELVTAAQLNAYVRDNLNDLRSEAQRHLGRRAYRVTGIGWDGLHTEDLVVEGSELFASVASKGVRLANQTDAQGNPVLWMGETKMFRRVDQVELLKGRG